jgi:hypothetical protein
MASGAGGLVELGFKALASPQTKYGQFRHEDGCRSLAHKLGNYSCQLLVILTGNRVLLKKNSNWLLMSKALCFPGPDNNIAWINSRN